MLDSVERRPNANYVRATAGRASSAVAVSSDRPGPRIRWVSDLVLQFTDFSGFHRLSASPSPRDDDARARWTRVIESRVAAIDSRGLCIAARVRRWIRGAGSSSRSCRLVRRRAETRRTCRRCPGARRRVAEGRPPPCCSSSFSLCWRPPSPARRARNVSRGQRGLLVPVVERVVRGALNVRRRFYPARFRAAVTWRSRYFKRYTRADWRVDHVKSYVVARRGFRETRRTCHVRTRFSAL